LAPQRHTSYELRRGDPAIRTAKTDVRLPVRARIPGEMAIPQPTNPAWNLVPRPRIGGAKVALHHPIDVQPYPIRLVNWFMSK
jgi:hypothetical protein